MMKNLSLIGVAALAAFACACSTSNSIHEHSSTHFSKADSLTDAYLVLSDSLLQSWNRIVGNELDKSRALQEIIDDLENSSMLTTELRESLQVRMDQLEKIRFTQESIRDPQSVEDYDVAFQSIVDDLANVSKANAEAMFKYLQDNSVTNRVSYDSLAKSFNDFVEKNKSMLKEINSNNELEMKPLFTKVN